MLDVKMEVSLSFLIIFVILTRKRDISTTYHSSQSHYSLLTITSNNNVKN